ncbi:MAG: hypothetical protein K5798_00120 [Nitrosopumilus sp.]|uniref:hypothetical protein n=1 Tax=Nitrosopumilus sp. TaxID=2024843 RepID=UPI00242FAB3B|nr:hypothetical protein [Nitrosopumilus sp.]MCV0365656.1 hypothetical protein [Nitrosopumilus sp.]
MPKTKSQVPKPKKFSEKQLRKIDDILEKMTDEKTSNGRLFVPSSDNTLICLECAKPYSKGDSLENHFECIINYDKRPDEYLTYEIRHRYLHSMNEQNKTIHKKCKLCKTKYADTLAISYMSVPDTSHAQRDESMFQFFRELRNQKFPPTGQIDVYCNNCSKTISSSQHNNHLGYYLTVIRMPSKNDAHLQ